MARFNLIHISRNENKTENVCPIVGIERLITCCLRSLVFLPRIIYAVFYVIKHFQKYVLLVINSNTTSI